MARPADAMLNGPGAPDRYREARTVTVIGAVVNLALAVAKIVFGVIGNSQALVADGVHSLSDLISDGIVLVAAKHGSREADAEHPYGHARIETAFTVGLGLLLMLVAFGIIYDAVRRLFAPELLFHPGWIALAVALVSVLAKEALYHYTVHVAKRVRSNLLRANAWHHRSDAVSSIVVIVGVAGTMAGLTYLDAIAAIAVGLMIAKVGWDLGWHSMRELVDTGLEPDRVEAIRRTILDVGGVDALHMLRTRRMGPDALVDVHILVDPNLSVSEGHQIGEAVRARVIGAIDEVTDVTVHIDPEDDEAGAPNVRLPLREELMAEMKHRWQHLPEAARAEKITLHYLNGRIHVDVLLPLAVLGTPGDAEGLTAAFNAAVKGMGNVARVRLLFH